MTHPDTQIVSHVVTYELGFDEILDEGGSPTAWRATQNHAAPICLEQWRVGADGDPYYYRRLLTPEPDPQSYKYEATSAVRGFSCYMQEGGWNVQAWEKTYRPDGKTPVNLYHFRMKKIYATAVDGMVRGQFGEVLCADDGERVLVTALPFRKSGGKWHIMNRYNGRESRILKVTNLLPTHFLHNPKHDYAMKSIAMYNERGI